MRLKLQSCNIRAVVRKPPKSEIELSSSGSENSEQLLLLLQVTEDGGEFPAIAEVCAHEEVRDAAAAHGARDSVEDSLTD